MDANKPPQPLRFSVGNLVRFSLLLTGFQGIRSSGCQSERISGGEKESQRRLQPSEQKDKVANLSLRTLIIGCDQLRI